MNLMKHASSLTAGIALAMLMTFTLSTAAQMPPQKTQPKTETPPAQQQRPAVVVNPERANQLYVSKDPKDHTPGANYQADMDAKAWFR